MTTQPCTPSVTSADTSMLAVLCHYAQSTPDSVALRHGDRTLTYAQLLAAARRMQQAFLSHGVLPGSIVAIGTERGMDVVLAMVSALLCRAAYLPLDATLPASRIGFLLKDAQPVLTVGSTTECERFRAAGAETATYETMYEQSSMTIEPSISGSEVCVDTREDLAYVMYTSGSTGEPKGVRIAQRGILRLVRGANYVQLDGKSVLLQHSSLAFDAATFEIWGALLNGGTCLMMEPARPSLEQYGQAILHSGCTTAFITSALFHELASQAPMVFRGMSELLVGGDVISAQAVRKVLVANPGLVFVAVYGPTESTTFALSHRYASALEVGSEILLGTAIHGTSAHVLDEHCQPVEAGVVGELYLGDDGVALGYLNRPELNAYAFLQLPALGTGTFYRTGDLCLRTADGMLHFRGRRDRQIKLRGFRIELDEIQSALERYSGVTHAHVRAVDGADGQRMVLGYATVTGSPAQSACDEAETIEEWEQVYSQVLYRGLAEGGNNNADPTFNTAGWKSSFDGRAIPLEQMEEQVGNTVERILALRPRRVLEIGCGTGMLLFRIAQHCESYVATDFSQAALDYLATVLPAWPHHADVRLMQGVAHELPEKLTGELFDTVILNSVTEHFSSLEYLRDLLDGLAPILAEGALIFVGDNRSFPLLRHFHGSIQAFRHDESIGLNHLALLSEMGASGERQLTIDPRFFLSLDRSRFTPLSIDMKRGQFANEMTAYRFDALLRWGAAPEFVEPAVVDWQTLPGLEAIQIWIEGHPGAPLQVNGVPNARLTPGAWIDRLFRAQGGHGTLADLHAREGGQPSGVDPEVFRKLGEQANLDVHIAFNNADPTCFDVLLRTKEAAMAGPVGPPPLPVELSSLANDPMMWRRNENLRRRLRTFLKGELPDYAVPAHIVVLPWMPLNRNGKLDAQSLPLPSRLTVRVTETVVTGGSVLEAAVLSEWEKILGITNISPDEDFFEIGGNSLSAVRCASELSVVTGRKVLPSHLFEAPTARSLGRLLAAMDKVNAAEPMQAQGSRGATRRQALHLAYATKRGSR